MIEWITESPSVAILRLHRPEARNALTWSGMDLFAQAVRRAASSDHLKALIITGAGDAFCSGGDLFELHDYLEREDGLRLAGGMGAALDALEALPFPTIAAIEGPALGGGAELALACDLRVAADGASLGLMHVRLAITPAWGGGQRLLRLVGYGRAFEWLTTGRVLSAEEAYAFGLINRRTGRGQALDEARALAEALVARDPAAVRAVKRLLRAGLTLPYPEAMQSEREEFPDRWASAAHRAASAAFVARRESPSPRT
jgi:enoyl-CoA hydratase